MKKILTLLLTLFMVFTLVGCGSKEDTPIVEEPEQQEVVEPIKEEPELVGGFIDVEDGTLTDELKDIFTKALEGLLGASYEPVELVATQVVAGTNYKFLANGTKTTNPITKGTYYVTVYEDLQGNVSLLDIETIEEKQEETPKQDVTQMSFWVVFYDQYGNELQRETLKYGTVPEYKSWLPEGFDKWVYKNTGKDVGTLKAIIGNTYYQAVCHEVYHSSSGPTPAPVDKNAYKLVSQYNWFAKFSSVVTDKSKITNITFTKNVPLGAIEVADLTANSTGNVKGYYIQDGYNYKIYIVGDYIYGNEDCMGMFLQFTSNLLTFDFSNFDTSLVTNMTGMFNGCTNLSSLDLSSFNTSNVSKMNIMFNSCKSLSSLDLSSFNTSNVTDMTSMFLDCTSLSTLNISNFNTTNVTTMATMFKNCSSLSTLNLSNFNTSKVTKMNNMFEGCLILSTLNISSFNTSMVETMSTMFKGCSNLSTLDLSSFNTSNVTIMGNMFEGCSSLSTLDLSNFNTSNVTAIGGMFKNCSSLSTVTITNADTKIQDALNEFGGTWTHDGSAFVES